MIIVKSASVFIPQLSTGFKMPYTEFYPPFILHQTIWPSSWCCTCESFVNLDQGGIQENNYNFPGAEIHVQTWPLHTKTYCPDEGQGRCRGDQAEADPGQTESGVLVQNCACSNLFAGRWTYCLSHSHTHAHCPMRTYIQHKSLHSVASMPMYALSFHTWLLLCAQITASCTCMLLCSHLTVHCVWIMVQYWHKYSVHRTKALRWDVKLFSAASYCTLARKKRTFLRIAW